MFMVQSSWQSDCESSHDECILNLKPVMVCLASSGYHFIWLIVSHVMYAVYDVVEQAGFTLTDNKDDDW